MTEREREREISLDRMNYRVIRTLGSGAGSTILLVADHDTNQQYALKVVKRQSAQDEVFIKQAIHEFDVTRRLNHPNLLKVFGIRVKRKWFKPTGVELLMEYVDGRTLDEFEKPPMGRLLLTFIKVAAALEHMHRRGVYHGDLKPGNIMVSRKGEVKVIDFGTAWLKGQDKNRVQGTLQYMAPEQAARKIVDERTDLYNFGATMYRMFTGQHANVGGLPHEMDGPMMHWTRPKAANKVDEQIPTALNTVIMACLEPNPDKRPRDIRQVRDRLETIAQKLGLIGETARNDATGTDGRRGA
jgi:serine/threonine-protein kinase